MNDKTMNIVNAFRSAVGRRDFATARKLLSDGFSFQGPFDTFDAPEAYMESLQKLYPIVKGVHDRRMFVDGDDACVIYDMETSTAVGTQLICEWFRVHGDKIVNVRAIFDARPFAALFSR